MYSQQGQALERRKYTHREAGQEVGAQIPSNTLSITKNATDAGAKQVSQ